ncbi:hypothetical protein BVRB_4g095080 [Beta vulgaris subsp. vulgaris]|uniref:Uncharacterized protein n=1 Tax=Beta vulgaris subsp. vulgaris TaxID=3555 RepID=A0A0J8BBB8_BETVV|nr:hypothetical protein BVRB_4g095080 [Beta vulgaris subsp. vulgaris]
MPPATLDIVGFGDLEKADYGKDIVKLSTTFSKGYICYPSFEVCCVVDRGLVVVGSSVVVL